MTPDTRWLPEAFLNQIFKDAGAEYRIEKVGDFADFEARMVQADAPSLVWIPLSWARGVAPQKLMRSFATGGLVRKRVHPDFATMTEDFSYAPMLWALEGNNLRIEGLAVPNNGADRGAALRIMEKWTSDEVATMQLQMVNASSALSFSDTADLPADKKATSLRDRSLKNIRTWQ